MKCRKKNRYVYMYMTLAYINDQQMSVIYNSKSIWLKLCKCVLFTYTYILDLCVLRLFNSLFNFFALGNISLLVVVVFSRSFLKFPFMYCANWMEISIISFIWFLLIAHNLCWTILHIRHTHTHTHKAILECMHAMICNRPYATHWMRDVVVFVVVTTTTIATTPLIFTCVRL